MNAAMIEPAVERRCGIDEVFARPFIELITLAPKNPVVRGLILAQTRKLPGAECETFEQIKEWVETTCDKKLRPTHSSHPPSREAFTLTVEFSETEHGRAHYSVDRSGSDEFALEEDEVLEMVRKTIDDGDGLEEVINKISDKVDEDAWNRCDPSLDNYGDYDYEDHDSGDSNNLAIECNKTQIRDRLRVFLRERYSELLEELA